MEQIGTGTISALCVVWLGFLLAAACWTDVRSRRVSNKLVLAGALTGLALNTLLPEGSGLFNAFPGGLGFLGALGGFAVGFGALLPLYLLRAMGAGDVKLMAMVGAFLGPASAVGVVLTTLVAGGALAIAVALWSGALRHTLANVRSLMIQTMFKTLHGGGVQMEVPPASAGNLPYAVAIAAGTFIHLLLERSGHALFA